MMSFPLRLFWFYFRNVFHGGLFLLLGCMENLPDKIPYIKGDYREGYQVDVLDRQMKFSLVLPHSSVNERCILPPSRHYDYFKYISLWFRVRAGHLNGGLDKC